MDNQTYKAPGDLRFGSVTLRVRDLAQMVDFYSSFFGLQVLHREDGQIKLGFELDQPLVVLYELSDGNCRPTMAAGLYHFALLTPAREKLAHALRVLLESGYPLQGFADHFVSEAFYLADPEGNGIEIYADRPRDAWQWDGGQLRIGTVALKLDSLLALLDHRVSEHVVLSPGTVIGHIHLQVSHLADSMDFYDRVLGFDSMGRFGPSADFYSAGGYHHHIGLNTWASAGGPKAGAEMLGLDSYEIILPDCLQLEDFIHSLAESEADYIEEGDGVSIVDPSGNQIWIRAAREVSISA